jgi:cytoskeletal protein CcmA (bactofilin family)
VKRDYSLVVVPQGEDEVATFDWNNFLPSKLFQGKSSFSVIDESTGIDGKLITRTAFIHGQIKGLIFAEHVHVEKTAVVNGIIFCRTLSIYGNVKANIVCSTVIIRNGGMLSGVLKYQAMKIESGASVNGKFEKRTIIDQQGATDSHHTFLTQNFEPSMRA